MAAEVVPVQRDEAQKEAEAAAQHSSELEADVHQRAAAGEAHLAEVVVHPEKLGEDLKVALVSLLEATASRGEARAPQLPATAHEDELHQGAGAGHLKAREVGCQPVEAAVTQ